ncbi:MAG: hypothetical protein RI967_1185 [Planctomycetota bacterium]
MPDPDRGEPNGTPRGESRGELHAHRAREMLRQGRLADAERELRAAVASDPTRGDWMLHLGWALEATGRHEEALQQYRQAGSLLPTARDPRLAEGLLLAKMQRPAEAAEALEATLRLDPRCETAASMLIRSLAIAGRHDDAETAYYMALHAIERPATSHLEIARSLLARGDLRRAEHCYRRAIAEGPSLVGARTELARLLVLADRANETAVLLNEEFRRGGVPPPLALEAARIHLAAGRAGEASGILEQLARSEPSNPRLHLLFARTMRRRSDLVRAVRHLEIARRLAPDAAGLELETALTDVARGRLDEARAILAPLVGGKSSPSERLTLLETIEALIAVGLAEEAARLFTARFGPLDGAGVRRDRTLVRLAARIAFETGSIDRGRALSRRLLRLATAEESPDPALAAIAIHNLALAALREDRLDLASAWIERGLAADGAVDPTPSNQATAGSGRDGGLRKLRTLLWWRRLSRLPSALLRRSDR